FHCDATVAQAMVLILWLYLAFYGKWPFSPSSKTTSMNDSISSLASKNSSSRSLAMVEPANLISDLKAGSSPLNCSNPSECPGIMACHNGHCACPVGNL